MKTSTTFLTKKRDGQSAIILNSFKHESIADLKLKMVQWFIEDLSDDDSIEMYLNESEIEKGIESYSYDVYSYSLITVREAIEMFGASYVRTKL